MTAKCEHGLTTTTCSHCVTDELLKKGGLLHISPSGEMNVYDPDINGVGGFSVDEGLLTRRFVVPIVEDGNDGE